MTRRLAFLFPGQGSQHVGMGQDFWESSTPTQELFTRANETLGFDLKSLCFQGPREELNLTANTQPAILLHSVIAYRFLEEKRIEPVLAAGHSLGEYSALVAAGSLDVMDALQLVRKRGRFMQEAVMVGQGAMAAILGLEQEAVEEACSRAREKGVVQPANFNGPAQIVISGEKEAVKQAAAHAKDMGAKKTVFLPVSAPFHCPMMVPAEERLAAELDKAPFQDARFPVVTNFRAETVSQAIQIKEALKGQVSAPVRWEESMRLLLRERVDTVIEVGPGKTLLGLMKRIDRRIEGFHVENCSSLQETLKALN